MKVAVVGGGWAGLAAAVRATQAGHAVTVFEAARTLGGRARSVPVSAADGQDLLLDNGQHILIGAYRETLALMRLIGVDPDQALLRLPLALVFPDRTGLVLPDAPPGLDAAWGILRARGWTWRDRLALLKTALGWQLGGFDCAPQATVAELCAPLPQRLKDEFIEPLCVSALNTPMRAASGQVFLRVLRDALFSERGGSNLLLPRAELGALLPDAAARWLRERGQCVATARRVQALRWQPKGWQLDGEDHDRVILALPSGEATRLARTAVDEAPDATATALAQWADAAAALRFESITTVYARVLRATGPGPLLARPLLARPMLALRPSAGQPAQFVFDRSGLTPSQGEGLLAFVISASADARDTLQAQVAAQARAQLGLDVEPLQTIVEKRATFACTPALRRPGGEVAPALRAAADYVEGPYPATLEGAVRSGWAAGAVT